MMSSDAASLEVWAIRGIPEIQADDDLVELIAHAADGMLENGDILVVTSKIVSKAEGRYRDVSERAAALEAETIRVVAEDAAGRVRIVESRLGIVAAAAGIDASNTPEGRILLLPVDPDASARALAAGLRDRTAKRLGVIVSDSLGRAWRRGQIDCAIGAGGVVVVDDLRGTPDAGGRTLDVTEPCVGDELAAAADLVKGKAANLPVAVVRGRGELVGELSLPGAAAIIRPAEEDLFRLGAREAFARGLVAKAAGAGEGAELETAARASFG